MTLDLPKLISKLKSAPQRLGTFDRGDPKPLDEYRVVLTGEERDWLDALIEHARRSPGAPDADAEYAEAMNNVAHLLRADAAAQGWRANILDALDWLELSATIKNNHFNVPEINHHNEMTRAQAERVRLALFSVPAKGQPDNDLREALAWALNEIELEFGLNKRAYPADKAKKTIFERYKALASRSSAVTTGVPVAGLAVNPLATSAEIERLKRTSGEG